MGIEELANLANIGKLKSEAFDSDEFDGLVASGKVRLRDAKNKSLHLESRFDLAYNAAHLLALAALRRIRGRRPTKLGGPGVNREIGVPVRKPQFGLPMPQAHCGPARRAVARA
ncbi:MAG: hypothetical protein HN348_02910 [Proteobacteria bacterium]|jgi:hypothetical protein|nr:hypothetical protein [Pseudomonadota bacterium]